MKNYTNPASLQENDTTMVPFKKISIQKNINLVAISIFPLRIYQNSTQNQGTQSFTRTK